MYEKNNNTVKNNSLKLENICKADEKIFIRSYHNLRLKFNRHSYPSYQVC